MAAEVAAEECPLFKFGRADPSLAKSMIISEVVLPATKVGRQNIETHTYWITPGGLPDARMKPGRPQGAPIRGIGQKRKKT